jgi:REP element-mobilizing transposase RayT
MTDWRPEFNPAHLYFVTTTAVGRSPIFQRDVIKRIIVDSLYFMCSARNVDLYAFVIMPNHVHFLIRCSEIHPLKDMMRDFKANTARLITRQYQAERNSQALDFLAASVTRPDRQQFKIWEDGYIAKNIFSAEFLKQKMDYIHCNPLQSHWSLIENPDEYIWSSARFYLMGEPALIPLSELEVWL